MPQSSLAGQSAQDLGREDIGHLPHTPVQSESFPIPCNDPSALLPSMLLRIEPEVRIVGRVLVAFDSKDSTHRSLVSQALKGIGSGTVGLASQRCIGRGPIFQIQPWGRLPLIRDADLCCGAGAVDGFSYCIEKFGLPSD